MSAYILTRTSLSHQTHIFMEIEVYQTLKKMDEPCYNCGKKICILKNKGIKVVSITSEMIRFSNSTNNDSIGRSSIQVYMRCHSKFHNARKKQSQEMRPYRLEIES